MKIIKIFGSEIKEWFLLIIRTLPNAPISNLIRNIFWRKVFNNPSLRIGRMTVFYNFEVMYFSENVNIGENCIIDASNSDAGVFFGNNVLIAGSLFIRTANHIYKDQNKQISNQGHFTKKMLLNNVYYSVIIEDNVWISQNVTILSGVKIGSGAIIGAGCLIIKDVPNNAVMVSNTANILKFRN